MVYIASCSKHLRSVHTRELALAARSCNTLPEQSSLVCTSDFWRKNMLRNKTFAPEFCPLISNWFDMREQASGANLLHESASSLQAPWCVLKFACRDMTCFQLANQIGLCFSSTTHCQLTFKMATEGVEEDSVQIIDNKKSEETSWSVTNTRLVIDLYRDNPVLHHHH